jgi:hypothetical protein
MLTQKISDDLKQAMRDKNAEKLSTLRMLQAALKNEAINLKKAELEDAEVNKIIKSEIKKRKDSIEAYQQGGREDLAASEMKEKELLESYLPAQLSVEEVTSKVQAVIAGLSEDEKKNFGALMGRVMKELGDQADGNVVRQIVQKISQP